MSTAQSILMTDVLTKLQKVENTYRALVPDNLKSNLDPVRLVHQHLNEGSIERAAGELFQLEFFCKHLNDVRGYRPDVFDGLVKRIIQCAQPDNYYGVRMETRIASSMARKGLIFELRERPDFSVEGGTVSIECGSVWPSTSNPEKDYRERVSSTIRNKDRKRYATSKTILALEVTSVIGAMIDHGKLDDETDFHYFLSQLVNNMSFGSVLLFSTIFSQRENRTYSTYNRIDSPRIDSRLAIFMENNFPQSGIRIDRPFVPGQTKPNLTNY